MALSAARLQQYKSITLSEALEGKSCDGCILPLRLLNVKKSERNSRTPVFTFRRSATRPSQSNQDYDRLFLCGDLSSSTCCVFFSRTIDTTRALIPEGSGITVGRPIVAVEPRFLHQFLDSQQATPVLRTSLPFFAMSDVAELPTLPIELQAPSFVHFHLKNIQMTISSFHLITSCGGSFCNRLYGTTPSCGCISKPSRPSFVLEAEVDLPATIDDDTFNSLNGSCITGLRFTKIFLNENALIASNWKNFDLQLIKNACTIVLSHINNWTLSGWTKARPDNEDHLIGEARVLHIVDAIPHFTDEAQAEASRYVAPQPHPILGTLKGAETGPANIGEGNSENDHESDSSHGSHGDSPARPAGNKRRRSE